MKLYTEEQLHSVMLLALGRHGIYIPNKHYQDLIDLLTPIELPSDSLCINCDESKSTHNVCMDCIIKIGKENIQLPSDEEIDEESPYVPDDASLDFWAHKEGFVDGAKWMRDKIGGNNG